MLQQQEIWKLMARSVFGEDTPEEKELLQKFLQENPQIQQQYEMLSTVLPNQQSEQREVAENSTALNIIEKANRIYGTKKGVTTGFKKYAPLAAAAIVLFIATSWFFFPRKGISGSGKEVLKTAFTTSNGSRKHMTLPDGSKVWLNAGSKLYYITDFKKAATREVKLEGEGFFEVVKNVAKPFIVHANNINIKVLGTAFNVKAYQEDLNVETTLYRGLVNITKSNDNTFQPIMLYPNQKIIVPTLLGEDVIESGKTQLSTNTTIKKSIIIQQIDSTKVEPLRIETAWMYNRLEFRGDDFTRLAQKLERWYNVKIVFEDEKLKQLSFNGSFEKENIEQALLALSTANSFHYKINNHEVFISTNQK